MTVSSCLGFGLVNSARLQDKESGDKSNGLCKHVILSEIHSDKVGNR